MSEVQAAAPAFANTAAFIEHLKTSGTDTVAVSYVVENLEAIIARPVRAGTRRGQLAGLQVEEMTDEQLKREKINANSVLYKAVQRNADQATIDKNQARVNAVNAEVEKRKPAAAPAAETGTDAASSETNENIAAEV